MTAEKYVLEHFYYGQFARNGKPEGDLRVLATSPGLKMDEAAEIARGALLPPLKGTPDGAWAVVRGKKAPFLLIQSQAGTAGQAMTHYVLMPSEALRTLGGNLDALMTLVEQQMPTYDRLGDPLKTLDFTPAGPLEGAQQIEHILELMNATQNNLGVIEALLAAIVQGVQVIVQSAPRDLASRASFLKGLLALLPPPARFGVTFTTHSVPSTRLDAQVRFYSDDEPPPETLLYYWPAAEISGKQVEDEYSHFIISQLRLDAELVSQRTRALTSVAAWRIKRGDRLADALGYASHRLALDNSLLNNLPVEIEDVSEVLGDDPTLSDELRVAYARHLLSFSLALEDLTHADPIALLLRQHDDLEAETLRLLGQAVDEGKPGMVYEMLTRWLANPLGPHSEAWPQLAQRAAIAQMEGIVQQGDTEAATAFLEAAHEAHPGVEIGQGVPRLVELALPLAVNHKPLAETTFLLAVNYLDIEFVQRLLKSKKFVAQLPPPVGRLAPYLENQDPNPAPPGLLAEVSSAFGDTWRPLVLMRFSEAALLNGRKDLLDTSALAGLAQVALSPWGVQYDRALRWIVENLSTDEVLPTLDVPGPRFLLQILLARGAYPELASEMIHQSRLLYPGDAQTKYAQMVQSLFAETSIPTGDVAAALEGIEQGGIRSLPLAMAYIGALEGHKWSEVLDETAAGVTTSIFENRNILKVIHPGAMMALLRFHTQRHDVPNTARVASLFPELAVNRGNSGVGLMIRLYKALGWDNELRIASLELLRRYVRMAETRLGQRAVVQFGRELGLDVRQALEATLVLKQLMGGVDFLDYADFLHVAAELLQDTTLAYVERSNIPTLGGLVNVMQSMSGSLTGDDRETVMKEVIGMARAVMILGKQARSKAPRDQGRQIDALLVGKTDPKSGLDVLRVMGGYFAKGKRYQTRLDRGTKFPLAERSAPMVRDEAQITHQLLRGVIQALPPDKDITLTSAAILGEVESLWGNIPLEQQREMVRALAIDLQRLADLVLYITEHGDERALEGSSAQGRRLDGGKQQPKSTLEFYRYVYGYFRSLRGR